MKSIREAGTAAAFFRSFERAIQEADAASVINSDAAEESKSPRKTMRKKAAKKPAKSSNDNGSYVDEAAKVNAKKPARGRKPKVKSEAEAEGASSDDKRTATTAKKPAQKSPAKKAKKATASKTEDSNSVAANGSTEAENHATIRAPISSTPQDVIDVGSATPDARKRGWWSRGE